MARLLHDRYLERTPERARDLATGRRIALSAIERRVRTDDSTLTGLGEVLDHGRDGTPRQLAAEVPAGRDLAACVDAIATTARARGFVSIAADVYLRFRRTLAGELQDRALVLIAMPPVGHDAALAALVDAAAHSSRPHVLVTLTAGTRATTNAQHVREARAVYGAASGRRVTPTPAPLADDVVRQLERRDRAIEFMQCGRHAAADRLLRDVAAALLRRRAFAAAAETYVMLGRLLLERGRAADADAVYGEAAVQAESANAGSSVLAARLWQAAARTDRGQLTAAESLCRAVLLTTTLTVGERTRAEATLARVLLWQGRTEEAADLPFIRAHVADVDEPFVHATASRVLLAIGEVFEAGLRARALVDMTRSADTPFGRVVALAAHARVLLATGDLTLGADAMQSLRAEAHRARAGLRLARVELLWVDALRRAGRDREAVPVLRYLERVRRAAPPQLREAIQHRLRGGAGRPVTPQHPWYSVPTAAISLVAMAQREEDDRDALTRLFEFIGGALGCSRIELWSADAGPATTVLAVGPQPATRLGARVIEAGISIGPEAGDPGRELGLPVRLGSRLVGAIAARWPPDVTPRSDAPAMLEIGAAVAAPRLASLLDAAREEVRASTGIPELVGTSAAMASVRRAVSRAAASPFSVLIDGESGVGKELVARAIHQLSPRRERRFCDVNCAALPDDLIESELFGHARGAFTGAITERPGLVEEADGGTLFLDEVLDLSPRAQAKLLRVVQQQEVRRVGETFSRSVDVRFVSAANRDVRAEAAAGRFRQDLLYRLDVIRIGIPPLRERPEDIPLLTAHFWQSAAARVGTTATLPPGVVTALARYHWPGNVRELQNVIAALAVAAPARGQVRAALLPATVTGATTVSSGRLAQARAQFERRFVEVALARAAGSRSQAARELGLTRQGLLKLLARLQLR
jgi:DNA-binding NtrC family response regulator